MGKAYLGMASTFAEWERNTFMERSQQGIRKAVENGIYSGGIVAYGYRLNTNTKRLEIDEQESKVIRDIFGWILEDGQSCITIAKRLNAMGIPTRYAKDGRGVRGKGTAGIWRPGRVCNMLKNPAYKGEWDYGKRGKKKQTIRGICPAIIDEQTFALTQAKLRNNNHWSDRTRRRPYLLRSLIKCNICGHNFTGCTSRTSNNKELSYYRCNMTINRGNLLGEKCSSPTIKADIVGELVWQQICEIIQNPEVATKALQDKFDACNQAEYVAELADVKHRLEELKEAEQRLLVKYADPATSFTEEAFDGALQEVRTNRQVIQDRIKDLEKAMINEDEKRLRLNDVTEILDILRRNIRDASFETKRKVCELLVKEIRVGRNGDGATMLNIVYYFNKDWIQGDLKFELLTARTLVNASN
jgi:site-specific DNA recombinase